MSTLISSQSSLVDQPQNGLKKKKGTITAQNKSEKEITYELPEDIITEDNLEKLKSFFAETKAPIDFKNNVGNTLLMYAATFGSQKCLDYLLEKGANPLYCNKYRCSPLSLALQNISEVIIKKLLRGYLNQKESTGKALNGKLQDLRQHANDKFPDLLLYLKFITSDNNMKYFDASDKNAVFQCHREATHACEALGFDEE